MNATSDRDYCLTHYSHGASQTIYRKLHIHMLPEDSRERHGGYLYLVQLFGCTAYTAFKTLHEFQIWAAVRNVQIPDLQPGEGKTISVDYEEICYYDPKAMPHHSSATPCWVMNNGKWGLGLARMAESGRVEIVTAHHWHKGGISYHWIDQEVIKH